MTVYTVTVGEQPTLPLRIQIMDLATNTPRDLSGYSDVLVIGLPEGTVEVTDALHGRIEYTFTAPFDEPGTVTFHVEMQVPEAGPDISPDMEIEVAGVITARATPAQAYGHTAQQVGADDIQLAQAQIALVVDRELADTDVWDAIGTRDQKLLTQAISWQAVEMARTTALGLGQVPGSVTALSSGGQSISFASGTSVATLTTLSPVVITILNRLSWRRRQISAYLEADARGPAPDPWVRHIDYVVGHNFGLYVGTLP